MNTVRKGAEYERKIVNEAIANGKIALRMAASQGICDVVIIDAKLKVIELLQCKNAKSWTPARKIKHTAILGQHLNGIYEVKARFV